MHVGIVGCGVIGAVHHEVLRESSEVLEVVLCDLDLRKARQLDPNATVHDNLDDLLRDIRLDLVCLCTPHPSHPALIQICLEHQVPVLCEKPLCTTLEDLKRLKSLARTSANRQVTGIFQHRYAPSAQLLKELLGQDVFGSVRSTRARFQCDRGPSYYASAPWRGTTSGEGGGVVLNQGIHTLDLWQWLLGGVVAVSGRALNLEHQDCIEVEDTLTGWDSEWAWVRFSSGVEGQLQMLNRSGASWNPQIEVQAERGSFCYTTNDNGRFLKLDHEDPEVLLQLQSARLPEQLTRSKPEYSILHEVQIRDTLRRIQAGEPPGVSLGDALQANELVLAFYESSRRETPVSLPLCI
ncbi:MAG: Gfo/Idh/MocA family protein [bacterium]